MYSAQHIKVLSKLVCSIQRNWGITIIGTKKLIQKVTHITLTFGGPRDGPILKWSLITLSLCSCIISLSDIVLWLWYIPTVVISAQWYSGNRQKMVTHITWNGPNHKNWGSQIIKDRLHTSIIFQDVKFSSWLKRNLLWLCLQPPLLQVSQTKTAMDREIELKEDTQLFSF